MSRPYPLAVRPSLPADAGRSQRLDKKTRQELERRCHRMLSFALRAEFAQRVISSLLLATLQTADETLQAAAILKAMRHPALAEIPGWEQLLHAQYLPIMEQVVALTNQEVLRWLLEE